MALSEAELQEVENFARVSGLDEIMRLCMELRAIRAAYVTQAKRLALQKNMIVTLDADPASRYGKELNKLTGETDAPRIP